MWYSSLTLQHTIKSLMEFFAVLVLVETFDLEMYILVSPSNSIKH